MSPPRVVALCGGVGGAKLALGLYRTLAHGSLAVVVNTGDDFDHLGLRICPDIDTTLYTLAGLANTELGWGRRGETWTFMQALAQLGGESWFRLGDADLALHVERTRRLAGGESLSAVIADVARCFGISGQILPVSDDPVRTQVHTSEGDLPFQDYFVRRRCEPVVRSLSFAGAAQARLAAGVRAALGSAALEAIILCPSNPYLSIDPMLAVAGLRAAVLASGVPVVAVTPIVGGEAIKGPTAKIMRELGLAPTPMTIARHYGELITGFVLDRADAALASGFPCPVQVSDTVMKSVEDREHLARETVAFAASLAGAQRA